jgi:hypothetical protein
MSLRCAAGNFVFGGEWGIGGIYADCFVQGILGFFNRNLSIFELRIFYVFLWNFCVLVGVLGHLGVCSREMIFGEFNKLLTDVATLTAVIHKTSGSEIGVKHSFSVGEAVCQATPSYGSAL